MTATRDRRRDLDVDLDAEWDERSAFGSSRGWPWWGAVVLALGLSILGAVVDMQLSHKPDKVFEGAYFVGCVGAVCLVRRRNLFGPMVQPPLILAVTIPVVVVLSSGVPSGGTTTKLLAIGTPLINGFPVMAMTTGVTVVIGGIRFLVQRRPVSVGDEPGLDSRAAARRRPSNREADRPGRAAAGARGGRSNPARGAVDRSAARDRDRERGRGEPARGRANPADRGGRANPADRGGRSASGGRGGQDRGQPRGGRSSRDSGRRQPPGRRDDD